MNFEHLMLSCIMPIGISKLSLCTFKKKLIILQQKGSKIPGRRSLRVLKVPKIESNE